MMPKQTLKTEAEIRAAHATLRRFVETGVRVGAPQNEMTYISGSLYGLEWVLGESPGTESVTVAIAAAQAMDRLNERFAAHAATPSDTSNDTEKEAKHDPTPRTQ